eukprot:TRINITY_DN1534_c0_g2_i1.p1 TRINITY_DN1534_c0_g2~~TRINITY_DN1534_c0_g2_i1.p1  ORF type:complete len:816 (-),score=156.09 TRINITY_DN1534_c0_g2_i1:72-2519(-)
MIADKRPGDIADGNDAKRIRDGSMDGGCGGVILGGANPGVVSLPGLEAVYYLQQHLVGWAIGKGGATLREVEVAYGVKISTDQSTKDQGYSKMSICGEAMSVQAAAEHMNASLARAVVTSGSIEGRCGPFLLDAPPPPSEDRMVEDMRIEQHFVGWLLGKGGGVVREVEMTSGCKVSINQETRQHGYSRAIIHGTATQRLHAKVLIQESLERADARGGGPQGCGSGFTPSAFTPSAFTPSAFTPSAPERTGGVVHVPGCEPVFVASGSETGGGFRAPRPPPGSSQDFVYIEQKFVGWLLGRGGGVSREIEQESGCRLRVDQTTKHLGYSSVLLQGDPTQIEVAKAGVAKCLARVGGAPLSPDQVKYGLHSEGGDFLGGPTGKVTLHIEQQWIGWLVGKGGAVIQEIEKSTGSRLSLNQDCKNLGYSTCVITGNAHQAKAAQGMILEKIGRISGGSGVSIPSGEDGQLIDIGLANKTALFSVDDGNLGIQGGPVNLDFSHTNNSTSGGTGGDYSFGGGCGVGLGDSGLNTGGCTSDFGNTGVFSVNPTGNSIDNSYGAVGGTFGGGCADGSFGMNVGGLSNDNLSSAASNAGVDAQSLALAVQKVSAAVGDPALTAQLHSLLGIGSAASVGGCNTADSGITLPPKIGLTDQASPEEQVVELQLEQQWVGWLLGSRGKTVREIEHETGCRIGVDQSTKDLGYSVLRLSGTSDAIQRGQARIEASLAVAVPSMMQDTGPEVAHLPEEQMQVEQKKVGWILGKNGIVMKEIETKCGARISIDQSTKEMGYSTVKIRGGPTETQGARELIEEKLAQAGPR